ncbi:MAG: alpha/beta fold hydrolase [Planctomycetes bacterium]|nr:alpha/beta fold hydrolase [Planctomycetota bacterium]
MPALDLPLAELMKFPGRNPCPPDMDAFWDGSVAEMKRIDAKVELTPAAFSAAQAECFDLWFTGMGGAHVHAKYLRPKTRAGKLPAILIFHGYSGSSGDWFDKLAWVAQGYCVAVLDCRGQGGSSEDAGQVRGNTHHGHIVRGLAEESPAKLLFRNIFLDTAQLARVVMAFPEVDAARVGATGGSQGGALTLACAALEPTIKRAAPLEPFLCDYLRVWEMDQAKDAYAELKAYFRMYDPRHEREQEIFTRLGYIDCQHLAKRIRAKVLMGVGLMDSVCPPSTQFAAYNKITSPKELAIYPDFAHEGLPGMSDRISGFMAEL